MYKNCCVVLVSYNPTHQIVENVKALIPQVAEVFIVDNGSNPDSLLILEELERELLVNIHYNSTNLGIATGLNQGVHYASDNKYEWVATFDQDSLAPDDYIKTMLDPYYICEQCESIAIISPQYQTNTGIISFSKTKDKEQAYCQIKTTMTSGNLVKLETFKKVGLFDDSLFIDYVDHEFCLRVRMKGLSIIESQGSLLKHSLGNSTIHNILGFKIITTGHAPIRLYYKNRNLIKILSKYYLFEPLLIMDLRSLIFDTLKILFFEQDKLSKIQHICKGIIDGIKSLQTNSK